MNWYGVRVSGRVQLVIAAVLAVLLLVAMSSRCRTPSSANLTPFAPHGWAAVGSAAALLVWAFAGWEAVTSLSAEYRNPARDIAPGDRDRAGGDGRALPRRRVATVAVLGAGHRARRRCPTCSCSASAGRRAA